MALLESDLQEAVFAWATTVAKKYPELEWLYHCPNGEKRDAFTAQRLKQQGVKWPGFLILRWMLHGGYHGLRIELKRPCGKCAKPRPEQAAYIAFLTEQGYCARITNDFTECKSIILGYLNSGTNA